MVSFIAFNAKICTSRGDGGGGGNYFDDNRLPRLIQHYRSNIQRLPKELPRQIQGLVRLCWQKDCQSTGEANAFRLSPPQLFCWQLLSWNSNSALCQRSRLAYYTLNASDKDFAPGSSNLFLPDINTFNEKGQPAALLDLWDSMKASDNI